MGCNPLRWLWGVPLLAMWFLITLFSEREPVEKDLAARATLQLRQEGQGWANIGFEGRDGVLRGRAPSKQAQNKAAAIARSVWGVRVVKDDTNLLKSIKQYIWSAQFEDNNLVLAGFVPNSNARTYILGVVKTRFPNADIADQLELARGEIKIKPWLNGISFGLDQLSSLERGRLDFVNMEYSLAGNAPSYTVYKGVRSALTNAAPKGVQLAQHAVAPPKASPYIWHAKKSASQVVISGYVPSEKARIQLFEHAKKQFPDFAIIDRMETAAGAVPGWARATSVLLDQLSRLEEGDARMSDAALSLSGRAPSEDVAVEVKTRGEEDVPAAYSLAAELTFPKPSPPMINPFVTSIDADASSVRLFGYVPSEDEHVKLVETAQTRFPNRTIIDNLKLGSGAPQSWQACLVAGLSGIEKLGAGKVRLEGQKVTVSGETMDETVAESLPGSVRAAANRACTSTVNVKLNAPPEPQLDWSANNAGAGQVVLDGQVPSADTRVSLVAAAKKLFPDSDIIDRMSVVPGFARKWHPTAHTGLALLAKLRKGRASISRQELVVAGEAKDTAIASAVKGQLKSAIVRGYKGRSDLTVRSDSMIWAEAEAKRKAAAALAAAQGAAQVKAEEKARREAEAKRTRAEAQKEAQRQAEEKARRKAAAQARRKVEEDARRKAEEETRREAEEEARRKAEEEARRKAEEEARLKAEEEARLKAEEEARQNAQAEAEARDIAAKAQARRKAEEQERQEADAKARATARHQERARACRDAMSSLASSGIIRFKFGSGNLDRKSHATLDKIAIQAIGCPQAKITVSGHTDAVGSKKRNLALSERRARAVVEYLVGAGVARTRIDAIGYGETKPLVKNDSRANRAKNRRIEFDVR